MDINEMSGEEVFYKFIDDYDFGHNNNNIQTLNKICGVLGYKGESFLYGSSFELFIEDNPGCLEVIQNWMAEQVDKCEDWKTNLIEEIPSESVDDAFDNEEEEEEIYSEICSS